MEVINIKPLSLSMPASTSIETAIAEITVPNGHKYSVLEVRAVLATGTTVYVYLENTRVAEFIKGVSDIDVRRVVVNWLVDAGTMLRATGINTDGSAHVIGVELVYNDIT